MRTRKVSEFTCLIASDLALIEIGIDVVRNLKPTKLSSPSSIPRNIGQNVQERRKSLEYVVEENFRTVRHYHRDLLQTQTHVRAPSPTSP
jgi:predicted metallo-beta-lactamase superfamily hydrolase